MAFFLFPFSLVLKGTSLWLPDDSKPFRGPSLQAAPAAASPSSGSRAGSQPSRWWGPRRGPEAAWRWDLLPSPAAPAPPRLPRRRRAASLGRDHGDVGGDNSRGDGHPGDDPSGILARVGGTSPLLGPRDPRGPRPRTVARRRRTPGRVRRRIGCGVGNVPRAINVWRPGTGISLLILPFL